MNDSMGSLHAARGLVVIAAVIAASVAAASRTADDQPTTKLIYVCQQGSEVRDMLCIGGQAAVALVTDTHVLIIDHEGTELARTQLDRYDTDSPRMTKMLVQGDEPAIVTGGGSATTRHIHAYDLDGQRLWRIEPRWPVSDHWAGSINHVFPIQTASGGWGLAVLGRGNPQVLVYGSDGTLIESIDCGECTDPDLAIAEATLWSEHNQSLVFGTRRNEVVCLGPDGQPRFRTPAPSGATWIGVVRVVSDGGAVSGGQLILSVTCTMRTGELQNFEVAVDPSGECVWTSGQPRRTQPVDSPAVALRAGDAESGWLSASIESTQSGVAGLAGRQMSVRVWSARGQDVLGTFDLAPPGGAGRAGQAVGQVVLAVPPAQHRSDINSGFVAWGSGVWRIDVSNTGSSPAR